MKRLITIALLLGALLQLNAQLCVMTPNQYANPWAPPYKGCPDTVIVAGHTLRNIGTTPLELTRLIFRINTYGYAGEENAHAVTFPLSISFNGQPYEVQLTCGQTVEIYLPNTIHLSVGQPGNPSEVPIEIRTTYAALPADVRLVQLLTEVRTMWDGYPATFFGGSPYLYNIQAFTAECTLPNTYLEPSSDSVLVTLDNVRIRNHVPLLSPYQGSNLWTLYVSYEGLIGGYPPPLSGSYVLQDSLGNYLPIDSIRIDPVKQMAIISLDRYVAPHIGVDSSFIVTVKHMVPPTSAGDSIAARIVAGVRLFAPPPGWQPEDLLTSNPAQPTQGRTVFFGIPATGVHELLPPTLDVYSGPDASTVTVTSQKPVTVRIYSMNGSLVMDWTAKGTQTQNVAGLASGMYTVQVTSENGSIIRKLAR